MIMEENSRPEKHVTLAINLSNFSNFVLLASKIPLCVLTGSLAIIASVLDSVLDLVVGLLLWFARRAVKNENKYKFPIGKARMQPLGIVVFAAIMGTVSLQIVTQGFIQIFSPSSEPTLPPLRDGLEFKSLFVIIVMVCNIVLKGILWIYCRTFKNEIVQALSSLSIPPQFCSSVCSRAGSRHSRTLVYCPYGYCP
jgi:divalent metal cation (Fe/Co/Zn/Cd) transporter